MQQTAMPPVVSSLARSYPDSSLSFCKMQRHKESKIKRRMHRPENREGRTISWGCPRSMTGTKLGIGHSGPNSKVSQAQLNRRPGPTPSHQYSQISTAISEIITVSNFFTLNLAPFWEFWIQFGNLGISFFETNQLDKNKDPKNSYVIIIRNSVQIN